MYIKSIVLDGFKSYGQRTEINGFDEEFNAITGLNGSGKSNILDAICFVLGITNFSHVRAASLQDLIYKSGQAGVNKASVSITFDNSNPRQCPPGYEQLKEITITRQVMVGGKNKYLINGTNTTNKKVQDMFCSIQLNVNNPHFLIMQGKITKVLNMKPAEILAMVEEAAGTRLFEVKKQNCERLIEKKEAKLSEIRGILSEEIGPKMEKLNKDRQQFFEYQKVERELERMLDLYKYWQYCESKNSVTNAIKNLETVQNQVLDYENQIESNVSKSKQLDEQIKDFMSNAKTEMNSQLHELESQLKAKETNEAKSNASLQSLKDTINTEEENLAQLKRYLEDDNKALVNKKNEFAKVESLFDTLKQNDERDNEAFLLSQKKYEAAITGMEVNDEGKAQTLQEQLMKAREEAATAETERKIACMQLKECKTNLTNAEKQLGANTADYERYRVDLDKKEHELKQLQASIDKLNYSEERMNDLETTKRNLIQEIRSGRDAIENFYAVKPYTRFSYVDPEPNFDRRCVKGVVCNLIECVDKSACTALEIAAGSRLYNVIIDTENTGKKLLKYGQLQLRTTFIPLNKIRGNKIDNKTVEYAQKLVGAENCRPALSLIKYDKGLEKAMEHIFGNVFICKNFDVAKEIAFNNKILKKCVTMDGDVVDPAGILTGGSAIKGGSVLMQVLATVRKEETLRKQENELVKINAEIGQLNIEKYTELKQKLDSTRFQVNSIRQCLQVTSHHKTLETVKNLRSQIEELERKTNECQQVETKSRQKAEDLESKMKDAKGYKEKNLKDAESEMKRAKQQAEKSKKEWQKREQEYETLNLEINELNKSVENTINQIKTCEKTIEELKVKLEEMNQSHLSIKNEVASLQNEVKNIKKIINENNKDIQKRNKEKEDLLAKNNDFELKIKELRHDIKKYEDICDQAKCREKEFLKKINPKHANLEKAQNMSRKEGLELENKIKSYQEQKHNLRRTVNTKAQSMFEQEEKQYNECKKRAVTLENDKRRIVNTLKDWDKKKRDSLKLAHEQVSKDFGSIFSTLLPGASAKLVPPLGKTILDGFEIKVSLGGVWKESLSELSGGQRSLAALSLILSMLLFKPAPLYILDEVDAALDLSHTQNIGDMLKSHFKQSQFIVVSLKDGMFNKANVLFRTKFVDGVSTITRTVNRKR